jgi:cytochrome c peroxidase
MGVFRIPSLRGVTQTGPWLHDGSALSLEDVLTAYAGGGRLLQSGPYPGDGAENPYKSPLIGGFDMSEDDQQDLLAFLEALSDTSAFTRENLQTPFCQEDAEGAVTNAPCLEAFGGED